jgi:spoIIIJ-associated protein
MAGDPSTEASGETLGEAKWSAVKELARRFPGLTAEHVDFEVLEEPEEGVDARVRATADVQAWEAADVADLDPAGHVRELLERIVAALDLRASVDVEEDEEAIHGTLLGAELGLFIGKHGQTIDAVQHLANRVAFNAQDGPRKRVIIDAAGYRERREGALQRQADRAATDALRYGRPVAMDAMGSFERRIVHEYLRERGDVETYSEGEEPDRHLVVAPLSD